MQTPDYLEFVTDNVATSRSFYAAVFGMEFTDYGPDYAGAHGGDIEIGIARGDPGTPPLAGFRTHDIAAAEAAIREVGGEIVRQTYPFPGGRRFHFRDPGGTELLVYQTDEQGDSNRA